MVHNPESFRITDNLFQQAVSCPLKMVHYRKKIHTSKDRVPFRHRNKLLLRNAVALQFDNVKFTSDDSDTALEETKKWLKEDNVVICGAVLKTDICLTRIPALLKKGSNYTIIQVHGKLRKRTRPGIINSSGNSRTVDNYLLKAAYRLAVLKEKTTGQVYSVKFYFPNKSFKASVEKLHQKVVKQKEMNSELRKEFERLFATVDATGGVQKVLVSIPVTVSHGVFAGRSVPDAIMDIYSNIHKVDNPFEVGVHESCKYCDYRISREQNGNGCWSKFFPAENISKPDKHVYELIGHGNQAQSQNGILYQEQVPLPDPTLSFEAIQKYSGPTITIQQRRLLQLLAAKNKKVPEIWVKPAMKSLVEIEYPIHFLDFEAATYAMPLKSGTAPYEPVYFQFSCHTLHKNGQLSHTEWLDDDKDTEYTNYSFSTALTGINQIFEGTIVQYSPFERQAINNLIKELGKNSMLYKDTLQLLNKVRNPDDVYNPTRFLDLNKLIRDNYYNCFLEDKLGLKHVLNSILKWEKSMKDGNRITAEIYDKEVDFLSNERPNPYDQIQDENYLIEEGSVAMDAWLSFKTGSMLPDEKNVILTILRRYCTLDSYALFVIFNHLKRFRNFDTEKDFFII